jgi:hypothetical protein
MYRSDLHKTCATHRDDTCLEGGDGGLKEPGGGDEYACG